MKDSPNTTIWMGKVETLFIPDSRSTIEKKGLSNVILRINSKLDTFTGHQYYFLENRDLTSDISTSRLNVALNDCGRRAMLA